MNDKNYYFKVIELLKVEAEAIAKATTRLEAEQVQGAIKLLYTCQGKVVVVGIGKSGIVARKIAATLTSTGTSAIYLHPADALHGDLGIVTSGDVAIALSNSGETEELISIFPYLNHRQVPIIAILGNINSTLARNADVVLDASVDKEACPLNLAPTTSTTVALAIGDAIAMTLMQVKGLTPEDFALNHPAGRLGKRLTLRVVDIMHGGDENPTIAPTATWLEVITAISQGGLGAVNVVDHSGCLLGIITDGDLRRTFQKIDPTKLESIASHVIMTKNPITVSPDCLAYDALQTMENRPSQISVMPVVDAQGICLGLIRLHDIVRSGV
ncbi:SIS domain-containing protein [Calothrix sp. PCC 7507]|uniref:KpsF/GutQ family sugar-phosphate isomerase n=1 Tax=Calothrix sp. PCC 7507 TaxID=99598 RepID=UPI00029F1AAF|nr:KpsF/GutQ family sugar-phosphate isomerase [Calothrix sp. PCC 7507]AFY35634.1 KpsF/GutQ family protein [Calothrix sp. PCC 7507]